MKFECYANKTTANSKQAEVIISILAYKRRMSGTNMANGLLVGTSNESLIFRKPLFTNRVKWCIKFTANNFALRGILAIFATHHI